MMDLRVADEIPGNGSLKDITGHIVNVLVRRDDYSESHWVFTDKKVIALTILHEVAALLSDKVVRHNYTQSPHLGFVDEGSIQGMLTSTRPKDSRHCIFWASSRPVPEEYDFMTRTEELWVVRGTITGDGWKKPLASLR